MVYGHVITKFSGMGRFTYPWCSAGALRAPELRYKQHQYKMKSIPLFKVTGAHDITGKQAGAPGTSSLLPGLIKFVWYYNSSFNHQLGSLPTDFPCLRQIFEENIHTENQNLHYKLHCQSVIRSVF